ncbi:MAG: hypothetical protein M0003_09725 [Acidithiobacillus sp.]|nr:hypothetical protein [Acidithiobacillus sp.]
MHKILLENSREYFSGDNYILLIGLGFDSRGFAALTHFPCEKCVRIIGISNVGVKSCNEESIRGFSELVGESGVVIGNDATLVMDVADELVKYFNGINCHDKELVIDTTALSHELLAVIIGVIHSLQFFNKVTLLYVGAAEYSFNVPGDGMWLSRGVRSIRSILGFPGEMLPSRKLHLVVLAGFEVERASEVILSYEPASLSIGLGKREQSVSDAHHDKNKIFFDKLNIFVREQGVDNPDVYCFEFSCVDPLITKSQLLSHVDELKVSDDRNIVICPLNSKLSTVGVVLAAIERPEIQICYAEPDEYNIEGYALPGNELTVVSLENV